MKIHVMIIYYHYSLACKTCRKLQHKKKERMV